MKLMLRLLAMIALVLMSVPLAALQETMLDTDMIDQTVNDLMASYQVPGAAFAIVKDGEIVYAQGYGVRSTETNEPVDAETQFSIGSITKSFTALAIMQQVEAGTLDLDAPISQYLPELELSEPDAADKITLRHLLSNTSGIQPNDFVWYGGSITTLDEVPAAIARQPIVAEPGTVNAYNNLGYALAGYILQTVSGESWETYMAEHILQPLGMTAATTNFEAMAQTANHTVPHVLDVREGLKPIPFFAYEEAIAPAGAINANVLEMANYALFQLSGETLISNGSIEEMHRPQFDPSYGLGWVNGEHAGYKTVWHNGSIDGFGALLVMFPEQELAVVGMMNADYIDNIGFLDGAVLRVAEIALGIEPEQDILAMLQTQTGLNPQDRAARLEAARTYEADPTTYTALEGSYGSTIGGEITVKVQDERLFAVIAYPELTQEIELIEFESGKFIGNARGTISTVIEFQTDENGTVTLLQGGVQIGQKLGEGVELSLYNDPQNRFSAPIPTGFTAEDQEGYALVTSEESSGIITLGVTAAGDDLQADAAAFAEIIGVTISGDPVAINPIPLPNGQQWTQYVWIAGDGSVLAVNGYAANGSAYFITVQAGQLVIQSMLTPLNELLLGFTITQ